MSFFAGLISLLVGGTFLLLPCVSFREIGARFHRLVGYLSLAGWAAVLLMLASARPTEPLPFALAGGIALSILTYVLVLYGPRPGYRWVPYTLGAGLLLVWYGSLGYRLTEVFPAGPPVPAPLYGLQLLLSAAVLGGIVDAMICGHWYLVNTGLSLRPIRGISRVLAAVLTVKLILLAGLLYGLAGVRPRLFERLVYRFPVLFWVRTLVGLGGGLLFVWMSWRTLAYDNTQAATGILYACITWIVMGEFSAFYLTVQTGVPL